MTTSNRRKRAIGAAAGVMALITLSACGQIYPSKDPAQGPANGIKSDVKQVVVGFAQQQLQAPYFAAMQVRSSRLPRSRGSSCCSRPRTKTRSSR